MLLANVIATSWLVVQTSIVSTDFRVRPKDAFWMFLFVLPTPVIGLFARSRLGTLVIATMHASSALWLLPGAIKGNSQNMAGVIWWWPLPIVAVLVVSLDRATGHASATVDHSVATDDDRTTHPNGTNK